jgi:hypothetical protein
MFDVYSCGGGEEGWAGVCFVFKLVFMLIFWNDILVLP